jgi:hypothetical protein
MAVGIVGRTDHFSIKGHPRPVQCFGGVGLIPVRGVLLYRIIVSVLFVGEFAAHPCLQYLDIFELN